MKVLITDFHNASNRGDAAIIEGMTNALRLEFEDVEIKILTESPESLEKINLEKSVKNKLQSYSFRRIEYVVSLNVLIFLFKYVSKNILIENRLIKKIINMLNLNDYINSDLIVSVGGAHLSSFYHRPTIGRLKGLQFAKLLGKPVYIYAQSIGPFHTSKLKKISNKILNKLDLIILRDNISYKILQDLGVDSKKILVTADAAFAMDLKRDKTISNNKLESIDNFFDNNRKKISISIRRWSHAGEYEEFIKNIAKIVDKMIEKFDVDIVFASTCTGFAGYHTDDRIAAIDTLKLIKNKSNVQILMGEYTPKELYSFYKKMDLHIGTRMHSNILAMLSSTPIVPIQYEFKTKGLMEFFEIDNIIEIDNIDANKAFNIIEKAWNEREKLSIKIEKKMPEMKLKSFKSAKLIKNHYIKNYKSIKNESI